MGKDITGKVEAGYLAISAASGVLASWVSFRLVYDIAIWQAQVNALAQKLYSAAQTVNPEMVKQTRQAIEDVITISQQGGITPQDFVIYAPLCAVAVTSMIYCGIKAANAGLESKLEKKN